MKKLAIVQSNYIPWKGYFDLINSVDEFILFDDVQYTRRDWRNRNLVKTPRGLEWLTTSQPPVHNFDNVPVVLSGPYEYGVKDAPPMADMNPPVGVLTAAFSDTESARAEA